MLIAIVGYKSLETSVGFKLIFNNISLNCIVETLATYVCKS